MIKIEMKGLDKLQRDLKEAQRALESLNGTITTLKFNPGDRDSVQDAIRQMEAAVDGKITPYRGNDLVAKLANKMKASYREQILQRAALPRR